ncbi:leucine--tRNA ligase [Mycoplasma hyorhinis]|uniref:leucine--tRNA ligase n=1 Tax=Mesomycoplasma hyorhinis TaxID=2100 RepID=UPI00136E8EB7|nr:leucine--tRNA ligase [Mesomycoplasma hyorhinis]MXR38576.1 leucine--tRNA ligase [Mesomycoplasma hyorhinis]
MYNHLKIEQKWQKYWQQNKTFKTTNHHLQKFYVLDMFPYPSASGLHIGHPLGYTATDIIARFKRLNNFDVLHPIGWDAFGLPAEQYALSTKNHPAKFTQENIQNFKKQLISLGFSYDWDKEVDTTDPLFYEQTQKIFALLYKHNLAEIREVEVNWCPELATVLANEEVLVNEEGQLVSERGGFLVYPKKMKQWILKITQYADRLLEDLKLVNFPSSLKSLQENWIGKSLGWNVKFKLQDKQKDVDIFTTRLDTIFGATFLAISPNHWLAEELANQNPAIKTFIENFAAREKQKNNSKTGIATNLFAINPVNNKEIPIFICDYVIANYQTGALMGVPSHDERDKEFALLNNIEFIEVINEKERLINSKKYNNLTIFQARAHIHFDLKNEGKSSQVKAFKIKDWVFSRQRYWGEPFPIYFDEDGKIYLEEKLVELPYMENITPSGDGQSPLANNKSWVFFEKEGKKYRRETNTMPQWAGSSWYFLAYILKNADGSYLDIESKEAYQRFEKWMPVDLYIGGQEHAVGHLIYSRFWYKFLYDLKIVPTKEPFYKVVNQGMLLGTDGQKMSKSKGNIINPNEVVDQFGADSLRIYLMFMSPLIDTKAWSVEGIQGIKKWVDRIVRIMQKSFIYEENYSNAEFESIYHQSIKEIGENIEALKYNIAISKMMVYINHLYKQEILSSKKYLVDFLIMFSTFAPHIAEELLEQLEQKPIHLQQWPTFDQSKILSNIVNIAVQVNGKLRAIIQKNDEDSKEDILNKAKSNENVLKYIQNKDIVKEIYIKDKIVTLVVK